MTKLPSMNDLQCNFIIDKFEENKDILLNKSNKVDISRRKRQVWCTIAAEYNERFPHQTREWTMLKKKFENMSSLAKKWTAEKKKATKATGGGRPVADPPSYIQVLADLMKDSDSFTGVGEPIESTSFVDDSIVPDMGMTSSTTVMEIEEQSAPTEETKKVGKRLAKRVIEDLHKDVLELEKQKLKLEIEKLNLEVELLKRKLN